MRNPKLTCTPPHLLAMTQTFDDDRFEADIDVSENMGTGTLQQFLVLLTAIT